MYIKLQKMFEYNYISNNIKVPFNLNAGRQNIFSL